MVLGFAYLTRVNTVESKTAFEKAIKLDQADALSRLGLGLGKIREGDLADGRRDLEIAVSLDANNSIVRSYLGKVYYEEKRGPSERQYAIAKHWTPRIPHLISTTRSRSRPPTGRSRRCRTWRKRSS